MANDLLFGKDSRSEIAKGIKSIGEWHWKLQKRLVLTKGQKNTFVYVKLCEVRSCLMIKSRAEYREYVLADQKSYFKTKLSFFRIL